MSTHTPIPCFSRENEERIYITTSFGPPYENKFFIAKMLGNTCEENEANAEFIAKSVNNHDMLVEALKLLVSVTENVNDEFYDEGDGYIESNQSDELLNAINTAKQALERV